MKWSLASRGFAAFAFAVQLLPNCESVAAVSFAAEESLHQSSREMNTEGGQCIGRSNGDSVNNESTASSQCVGGSLSRRSSLWIVRQIRFEPLFRFGEVGAVRPHSVVVLEDLFLGHPPELEVPAVFVVEIEPAH